MKLKTHTKLYKVYNSQQVTRVTAEQTAPVRSHNPGSFQPVNYTGIVRAPRYRTSFPLPPEVHTFAVSMPRAWGSLKK